MQINRDLITSVNNEKISEAKSLNETKGRKTLKAFLIEGINTIKDLDKHTEILNLFVSEKALKNSSLAAFINQRNLDYYLVSDRVIEALSDTVTPSGAVCMIKIPDNALKKPEGDCLILDGISDPGNMGTIIRTSAAFGYNDIYCINCVDFYGSKVIRSSMGGIFRIRLYNIDYENINDLFSGCELIALDMDGINIKDYKKSKNHTAVIVGSEAKGINSTLLHSANTVLSLPMQNNMESLNASVAAGIVMYLLKN